MENMKYKSRGMSILGIFVTIALALAACSPTAQATATTAPVATNTSAPAAGPITLKVATNATLGSFFTDQNGMTLYLWKNDTAGTSNCTGACLQNWPAVLTNAAPTAGDPSIKGTLGVITRPEGQQATYNNIPLYYYIQDKAAGDTKGQGVGSKWYIVAPSTAPVTTVASLKVSQNTTLGSFLTDQNGMTVYIYTKDTTGTSTCFGGCLAAWPALLTSATPMAGDPAVTGALGVTTRPDGSQQVTYNGAPLYYFLKDKVAGDTTGQNVGSVWFVVPPTPATATPAVSAAATNTPAPTTAAVATPTGPATVKVTKNATLGNILVDQNGMTLYIFTKDTAGVSTCSGGCLAAWPALLTNGAPVSGDPSITGKLGFITRADGSQQVTLNDMPLYYYAKDKVAGDTVGQGVGSVWFVMQPNGTPKQ